MAIILGEKVYKPCLDLKHTADTCMKVFDLPGLADRRGMPSGNIECLLLLLLLATKPIQNFHFLRLVHTQMILRRGILNFLFDQCHGHDRDHGEGHGQSIEESRIGQSLCPNCFSALFISWFDNFLNSLTVY